MPKFYMYDVVYTDAAGQTMGWSNGKVVEADEQPKGSSTFKPNPSNPTAKLFFDGGGWREVSGPVDAKTLYPKQVRAQFESAIDDLKSSYPEEEIESWPKQEAEARALLAGEGSDFIEAMASESGEDPKALAKKIVAKADSYHAAYAIALGEYRKANQVTKPTAKDLNYQILLDNGII